MLPSNHKTAIYFIVVTAFIGISKGDDYETGSEELMRKIDPIVLIPDEKVFIHSVNDARMVTCVGNDLRWRSVNGTYVESYDNKDRIHVEDFSTPFTQNQNLSLIFKEILEMDHGDWTCVGIYEEKSFSMYVYVPVGFQPVEQLITVNETENAKISCEVYGRPKPEIRWMVNGSRLEDNDESTDSKRFIRLFDGLYIKNVTREDSGNYTCKAIQISSKLSDFAEQTIQLNVQYKPEIIFTERTLLNGKLNTSSGIIIKYSYIGAIINLTCEAEANPLPDIFWYHNGKKVSIRNVYTEDNLSILTIHIHNNKSFGDYKCKVKNLLHHAEMKIQVREAERPKMPSKLELRGKSNDMLDIDIGSQQEDLNVNPLAVTHYRFEMISKDDYISNGETWKNHNITDVEARNDVTYVITKLMPKTTYLVRVASISVVGLSDWTEAREFETLLEAPKKSAPGGSARHLSYSGLIIIAIFKSLINTVM